MHECVTVEKNCDKIDNKCCSFTLKGKLKIYLLHNEFVIKIYSQIYYLYCLCGFVHYCLALL